PDSRSTQIVYGLTACRRSSSAPGADGRGSAAKPDLLHERDQVVKEVLLDDLPIVPAGHGAEIHIELLARRRDDLPVGPGHRTRHRPGEMRDRAGPIAGG